MFLGIESKKSDTIAALDNWGQKVTYGEMCNFCSENMELIPKRTVVFILCRNTVGALVSYVYCVQNNVVPLLLGISIEKELLDNLLKIYEPAYIFTPDDLEYKGKVCKKIYDYNLIKLSENIYPISDQLELLMTTSGSTGSPKLVRYKKGNLECNAKNVAKAFRWESSEKPICDLAMNYTMGLNVINSHLFVGSTIVLTTYNLMSMEFWTFVKENKCTNFTGVPFSYELLMKLRFTRMKLPYLTTLAQGGGKLTDELFFSLAEYAKESGKRFIATFGTTETAARMSILPADEALNHIGSIGKAIPEGELFLLDESGKEINDSEVEGELGYRGPNVTLGYALNKEDLMKPDEFKGEYHTGDMARRDKEGYYYITGRKSRFLKLLGYRVNLDHCERLIKTKFNLECACVGTDQKMIVYICNCNGISSIEIQNYLCETLNLYASLFEVREIEQIPKNESGKIMYRKLRSE